MALIHELTDKLGELLETTQGQELSKAEAEIILQDLTHIDPDISKFLQRRFSRLALPLQQFVLQILDAAQAKHYASLLQAWSQEAALHLALRLQALSVLEHLGEGLDHLYHDALIQANRVFANLGEQSDAQITETGELQETWRQAVVNLPINLAIDLGGQLSPDHPSVALAVFRALLTAVDAKDCQLLVQRVANISQTESVQLLQHLLAETTEKSLQKTIKKALHRLRSQGLEIEGGSRRSHAAVVGAAKHHLEKCLASHIDGDGNRVLWMIRTKPFGGYNIAYLVINYGTGIQVAFGLQASKRELPTLLAQAQDQVRLIELDAEYCQYQIAVAHQMNLDTRTPVPEKFFGLQDIIGKAPTTFEKALIYSVLSEADLQEAQADSGHADDLLEIAEFA